MQPIHIFTDGACSGNPGPGGWGAVLLSGKHQKEISGSALSTTNQRMELQAVLAALLMLKVEDREVVVFSDSAYVVNAFQQDWITRWQKNGWKNSKKEDVANQDLWKDLLVQMKRNHVTIEKVKGHSGIMWNERCDQLAREAIKNAEITEG